MPIISEVYDRVNRCLTSLQSKVNFTPETAIVLGSGLGGYADSIRVEAVVPYEEIEDFPVSTVDGHHGRFVFGYVDEVPVVCMQGRIHYYEGYSMLEVVLPIRLMCLMGAKNLILTNAAGGIQEGMKAGDLMLITGQIASFVPSPLIGPNIEEWGTRFPDMSEIYDPGLRRIALEAADRLCIDLKQGVYLQMSGPQYESPQEVQMCRILGADAVGMSTCCEAIAARHMGMRILGISCISNLAAGLTAGTLSHEDVKAASDTAGPGLCALIDEIIKNSGK